MKEWVLIPIGHNFFSATGSANFKIQGTESLVIFAQVGIELEML